MVDLSQENRNIMFEMFKSELPQLMEIQNKHPGPTLAADGHSAGTGYFEGWLAYVLLRCVKPKVVFELGPMYGFATYSLALAVKNNGVGKVYTFESAPHRAEALGKNMENAGLQDWVHIVCGMFENESLPLLKQVGGKIDVLFCDDGHGDLQPKWYIPNLFPHVTQLVFVHDMTYGTPHPEGKDEKTVIFDFLRVHPEYQNFLVKDYYPQCPLPEKREGPGGSANSGIWIKLGKG